MINRKLWIEIDGSLRHLLRRPEDEFGGLSVILMGDFFQLPAIGGSLIACDARSPAAVLFSSFEVTRFTQQMRAHGDAGHIANLAHLSNVHVVSPVTQQFVRSLPVLSRSDVEHDPSWLEARIGVTNNDDAHK